MHILIAPNAFKGSLAAQQAAEAIEQGLNLSGLDCTTECFPIADGGDGTGSLIIERCKGRRISRDVHDPLGRIISASFGLIDQGKTAIIEMADASGLRLLRTGEPDPVHASSYGTGELISAAFDQGVKRIIIAMGGSATVDGGCGILSALGIRFTDQEGNLLKPIPAELLRMADIDASQLDERIADCGVAILCDVNNQLLGPHGAAQVFGPQKGASPDDVMMLEKFLENFAKLSLKISGKDMAAIKHGGAAGGATAGLFAWLNAELVNGIDYFLSLTGFDEALSRADLVITGEGSLDRQTLQGKGPYGVAIRAKEKGVRVIGMAGKIEKSEELNQYFDELIPINKEPVDLAEAMKNTERNLVNTAKILGNKIAAQKN